MRRMTLAGLVLAVAALATPLLATGPTRIGEHIRFHAETPHPYSSIGDAQPQLSWQDEILFPGATYVAPFFSQFELAPGDYVVVRSPDSTQSWTYTELGRGDLGRTDGFYAVRIKGERAIVELWTRGSNTAYGYTIDHFGRGYSQFDLEELWASGLGEKLNLPELPGTGESTCTVHDPENAVCYENTEPAIYDESRAVVRMLVQSAFLCTGWLVGDEGHMMTNEHCITDQTQASNTDYEFMAEGATCGASCPQLQCDGTIEATTGTFVQDSSPLDYALIDLGDATLPTTYGFMQLRETGPVLDERIYIPQHPAGRGKEIAVNSTYPADTGGFPTVVNLNEPACSGGPGDIGYWADTEGGSSGSPVLGYDDNLVVALHHCRGLAFCSSGNPGSDDPNRGVNIVDVITDLGGNLPNNSLGNPAMIFTDGFESGDVLGWSAASP